MTDLSPAARRPKPPSLREQALAILASVAVYELYGGAATDNRLSADDMSIIRRALEALAEAYEAEANNPPEGHPDPEPFQAILRERAAALAQPEPVGPTDEEVISAAAKAGFAYECAGGLFNSYIDSADIKPDVLSFARDLLARWGNSAKPEPQGALEEHYEWELEDASGEWVAGGSANDQEAVHQEGMRYLSAYSQDGPHKLTIRRHQVHTVLQASASVTDELPLD